MKMPPNQTLPATADLRQWTGRRNGPWYYGSVVGAAPAIERRLSRPRGGSHRIYFLMMDLRSVEAKAFVPARDFELSKRFYKSIGFVVVWSTPQVAYLRHDKSCF